MHKITQEELETLINKAKFEGIGYAVELFQKVMREESGFGDKRMGRVAEGIYKKLSEVE